MLRIFTKTLIAAILFFSVFATSDSYGQSWEYLGSHGLSDGPANYESFVIAGGVPYVVFQDGNAGGATLMKHNGTSWEVVGNRNFSTNIALFTSVAVDSDGTPYVAFVDNNHQNRVTVMKYFNNVWDTVGGYNFSAKNATFTNIAIDTSGIPYVVYIDGTNHFKATVKKYNKFSNTWVNVGAGAISSGEADLCTISFSHSNIPYVAFQDADSNYKATVMRFDGTNWITVGPKGFTAGAVYSPCITVDTFGIPYLVYSDATRTGKATVMQYNGGAWLTVGSAGFSDTSVSYTTIAVDGFGMPFVAYSDGVGGGRGTVAYFDGTSWKPVCKRKFTSGTAWFTSIALNGSLPYIAYSDRSDTNRLTVMVANGSAACVDEVENITPEHTITIYPNPATTELNVVSSDNEPIRSVVITNLLGQVVTSPSLSKREEMVGVDISALPAGVYFVRVNDMLVRKFVKE